MSGGGVRERPNAAGIIEEMKEEVAHKKEEEKVKKCVKKRNE